MDEINFSSLPPGFGFHPTDAELVSHYLKKKIFGQKFEIHVIPEVDIYKFEPWDLPAKCHVLTRGSTWHFFTARDKKYPNGSRANRATGAGYWKSTGKDRNINVKKHAIGTKKTLVFHKGRPPHGKRTDWIMHEYHLSKNECGDNPSAKDLYVLCRVTKRDESASDGEESTPVDEKNTLLEQPGEDASEVVLEESNPSDKADETNEWLKDLSDPNFSDAPTLTVCNTTKEEITYVPKQEPVESSPPFLVNVSDASLPLPEDILDADYMAYFNSETFGVLDTMTIEDISRSLFAVEDVSLELPKFGQSFMEINSSLISSGPLEEMENSPASESLGTGIQIRERRRRLPTEASKQKIRLQVAKMESRNRGPDKHIFELATQECHVQSDDVSIPPNGSDPAYTEDKETMLPAWSFCQLRKYEASSNAEDIPSVCSHSTKRVLSKRKVSRHPHLDQIPSAQPADKSGIKEYTGGGVSKFFHRFLSAGLSCLFVLGTAALVLYFLLRDARRFLGTFSTLGL